MSKPDNPQRREWFTNFSKIALRAILLSGPRLALKWIFLKTCEKLINPTTATPKTKISKMDAIVRHLELNEGMRDSNRLFNEFWRC